VGTALGGPFGGLAGTVLSAALGGADPKAAETQILSGDTTALANVQIAEVNLKAKLAELGVQKEQLVYADVDSARKREMTVKDWMPGFLAVGVTTGFFCILGFMLTIGKPPAGGDVLLVMIGALGTSFANIIGYYFGSSAGSADKTALLTKLNNGVH
jgi:hypothetical protein